MNIAKSVNKNLSSGELYRDLGADSFRRGDPER
jgi:hypothetical protein